MDARTPYSQRGLLTREKERTRVVLLLLLLPPLGITPLLCILLLILLVGTLIIIRAPLLTILPADPHPSPPFFPLPLPLPRRLPLLGVLHFVVRDVDVHRVLVVQDLPHVRQRGVQHLLLLVQAAPLGGVGQRAGIGQRRHRLDSRVAHSSDVHLRAGGGNRTRMSAWTAPLYAREPELQQELRRRRSPSCHSLASPCHLPHCSQVSHKSISRIIFCSTTKVLQYPTHLPLPLSLSFSLSLTLSLSPLQTPSGCTPSGSHIAPRFYRTSDWPARPLRQRGPPRGRQ